MMIMTTSEMILPVPEDILSTSVGKEWSFLKQTLLQSTMKHPDNEYCHGWLFPALGGNAVESVLNKFTKDEAESFLKVCHKIEDVLFPNVLLMYNRVRFFMCGRDESESVADHINRLVLLYKGCEFDDPQKIILKDVITDKVVGVDASQVQNILFGCDPWLTRLSDTLASKSVGDKNERDGENGETNFELCKDHEGLARQEVINSNEQITKEDLQVTLPVNHEFDSKGKEKLLQNQNPSSVLKIDSVNGSKTSLKTDMRGSTCRQSLVAVDIKSSEEAVPGMDRPISKKDNKGHSTKRNAVASSTPSVRNETSARPKRKVQIPSRLQSDENTLKLLRFNERSRDICEKSSKLAEKIHKTCDVSMSKRLLVSDFKDENAYFDSASTTRDKTVSTRPISFESPTGDDVERVKLSRTTKTPKHHPCFKCVQCGLNFKTLSLFKRHKYSHKGKNSFICTLCKASFSSHSNLIRHRKTEHDKRDDKFSCPTCGKLFTSALTLQAHQNVHNVERPFKCKFCGKPFRWRVSLEYHHRVHTGQRPYSCKFCDKRFFDISSLQKHLRIHSNKKNFSCDLCNMKTRTLTALKAHVRKHLDISCVGDDLKRYSCEDCGKTFKNNASLKCHKFNHSGEKPYSCEVCGATFVWLAAYKRHCQTHTNVKPYKCDICGNSYADKAYLKRHRLGHSGERPFKCEVCSSTFVTVFNLKQHSKIHSSEKKFMCEVCGASFVRKCYLYKHRRIHYGKKTHACDQCDRKFYEPHRLRDHKKRHEKAANRLKKRYICEVCGRVFAKKVYLTKHVMTHTGNKPYVCPKCPAKFVDSFKLKRHIRTHDKGTARKVRSQWQNGAHSVSTTEAVISNLTAPNTAQTVVGAASSQSELEHVEIHIQGVKEEVEKEIIQLVSGEKLGSDHAVVQEGEMIQYVVEPSVESSDALQQIIVRHAGLPEQSEDSGEYKIIIVEIP
ncbi:zinc finger protein 184 [Aplysia californica]|uniref:Zinc finger protein 184 n=1 Tax=Aplysia californica TaxID=6500 RepID=A0ABM0JJ74_APLCA|nr:zinc finger protein 184 [Aplysia californica]